MVRRRGGLSGEDQRLEWEVVLSSTVDGSSSCSIGVCHVGYFNQTPAMVGVNTKSEATLLWHSHSSDNVHPFNGQLGS